MTLNPEEKAFAKRLEGTALVELEALRAFEEDHEEDLEKIADLAGDVFCAVLGNFTLKNPRLYFVKGEVIDFIYIAVNWGYMKGYLAAKGG